MEQAEIIDTFWTYQELTLNDCERFGSADDLARSFFIF